LEYGCKGKQKHKDPVKSAFIGISNWALDPAKMNRGIYLQRDNPKSSDLLQTAK